MTKIESRFGGFRAPHVEAVALAWVDDCARYSELRGAWLGTPEHLTPHMRAEGNRDMARAVNERARELWSEDRFGRCCHEGPNGPASGSRHARCLREGPRRRASVLDQGTARGGPKRVRRRAICAVAAQHLGISESLLGKRIAAARRARCAGSRNPPRGRVVHGRARHQTMRPLPIHQRHDEVCDRLIEARTA